ncbi:hypothetical protein [Burkholderia stabilis]|uniref:Uncharacterized protein n=1 Tax=Burkholderia stabilis TaxID=95485 RepID=A0AAJ5T2R6_9BURK|nr:hypothetical protein [Burkholderia stabilis]VBB10661.1 hypothetical protein BSTAB16_0768 [Burkholderia stabilis]VBB13375.1 hypothetical protein BSTAB16_3560 [Burkholderia stabilis]
MNEIKHCQCVACVNGTIHASDCAVHNMPAESNGPCDCGITQHTPFEVWLNREGCLLDTPTKDQCVDAQQRAFSAGAPAYRKNAIDAIDGAIAFGCQNTNPPPATDHWLAPYWNIGRLQADLAMALELIAADADAGKVMIPSGLRLTIDAALIKAGRKAAPVRSTPCETCDGRGEIGGWRPGDGYGSDPCPDCQQREA